MTPERWLYVKNQPVAALDIDADLRPAYLDSICADDPVQRLIIHRDLKPNNILVTADGVPRNGSSLKARSSWRRNMRLRRVTRVWASCSAHGLRS